MTRTLRAYPTLLRIGFAAAVAYRAELVVWMLTTTMPLVSLALWSAVAANGPVGRFGAREFTAYFLGTLVVRQMSSSWLVWELNQEIKSGALSQRLLKPIHPLVGYSAENLAALPLRAVLAAPLALVVLWTIRDAALPRTAGMLAALAASIAGAWLINFFTMAAIGSLAFFIESSTAVFEFYLAGFMILSGYLVPLELFPGWLRSIALVLPFRYTLAFPTEILIGMTGIGEAVRGLAIQWTYVALCGGIGVAAWRAGTRRFAAYGG